MNISFCSEAKNCENQIYSGKKIASKVSSKLFTQNLETSRRAPQSKERLGAAPAHAQTYNVSYLRVGR